ncbi:MAG: hypothetical protein LBN41_05410 [Enterobacteriaceae bacterium]|jgi:hypothetical protein|nr:hypothetical protein [Enterobacteriaceae bacterium]
MNTLTRLDDDYHESVADDNHQADSAATPAGIHALMVDSEDFMLSLTSLNPALVANSTNDNPNHAINVALNDVLRFGSEELVVNSEKIVSDDSNDGHWSHPQGNDQYTSIIYNDWTAGSTGLDILLDEVMNPIIM